MKIETDPNGSLVISADWQDSQIVRGIAQGAVLILPGNQVIEIWQENGEILTQRWVPPPNGIFDLEQTVEQTAEADRQI